MIILLTNMNLARSHPLRTHYLGRFLQEYCGKDFWLAHGGQDDEAASLTAWGISADQVISLSLSGNDMVCPDTVLAQLRRRLTGRVELCIAHGPWAGLAAVKAKKQGLVKKVVYEDLDYFPGFYSPDTPAASMINQWEQEVVQSADLVVSVSIELARLRQQQTGTNAWVVGNGVNISHFQKRYPHFEKFTLVYTGGLTSWSGLDTALTSIAESKRLGSDIQLLVIGEGELKKTLVNLTSHLNIVENVKFLGKVDPDKLPRFLTAAHCGWACFRPQPLMYYASPLKVWEYMAAELPQLAVNYGYTGRVVGDCGAGMVIPFTQQEITRALMALANSERLRQSYSEKALAGVRDMDWNVLFRRLWQRIKGELL